MAQVIKRGPKRYLVRVFLGRDESGKRQFHNKTIHGTRKAADRYATNIQSQVDSGTFDPDADRKAKDDPETVADFLDYWLDTTAPIRVSNYTLDGYRGYAERYLKPMLGEIPLSKLEASDVQRLVADLISKGLAPRTVRYAQGVLRHALKKAFQLGKIKGNPADAKILDLPKQKRRSLTVLNQEEARAFVETAKEDRWAALWILLITSGARPGEALGLKWDDLNGENIRIQRALVRDRKGGAWILKEPKTTKSRRTVPLPSEAIDVLRAHRVRQNREKLAAETYADQGLVFADESGEPLKWHILAQNDFRDLLTEANLPKIRPYDLRHTCATLMLAAGVNPKVVSERLGHSTVTLTLDTYSAVLPGMQEEATEKLGALLFGS
jgi:integrase